METAYDKECNRWPGNSRCLGAIKGDGCAASVEKSNGGFKITCNSWQASKGRMPRGLLIVKKGLCCGSKSALLLSRKDGKLFCTYCFKEYCPNCGKLITENFHACYFVKNTIDRKYPGRIINY